jgi:hypothetical protein
LLSVFSRIFLLEWTSQFGLPPLARPALPSKARPGDGEASFEYLTLTLRVCILKKLLLKHYESDLTWIKDSLWGYTVIRQGSINVRADAYRVNSLFWTFDLSIFGWISLFF